MLKMELQIDETAVIPSQDLEGKVALIARITDIFPCDPMGGELPKPTPRPDCYRVQIRNIHGSGGGHSALILAAANFVKFQNAYGVNSPGDLMGKPVVSVYVGNALMLSGLIPVDLDR